MTQSQKYAIQLDNLRQKYKYTVDNFCSDIVDSRTFRRYKTGEKTLSFTKIEAFCDKLKISTSDFFHAAKSDDLIESKKIYRLHELLTSKKYDKLATEIKKIDKEFIFDIQNRRHYDYIIARLAYHTNTKSYDELLHTFSEIADYPKCKVYEAFDFVSVATLLAIAEIEIKSQNENALHLLMEILVDPKMIYTSTANANIIPAVYMDICIFLLRLHRYKAANYIADNGIKYVLPRRINFGLAHYYYTKAYALLMLDDKENAEINAVRCLSTAIAEQRDFYTELFYRVLKKDFKEDPYTFIEKHLKPLIDEAVARQQKIPK